MSTGREIRSYDYVNRPHVRFHKNRIALKSTTYQKQLFYCSTLRYKHVRVSRLQTHTRASEARLGRA